MIDSIASYIEWKSRTKNGSNDASTATAPSRPDSELGEQRTGFTKVFRWPVPAEQTAQPTTVEVVGSFSDWHRVPLAYDKPTRTWIATLNSIPGNHTHRYVILVDGKPTYDKTCDGLAAPQSPAEARWQIETPRGPRVMLLFAQTK